MKPNLLINRASAVIALLFSALVLGGCASKIPSLKVYPATSLPFIQRFPRAYLSVNSSGDYEILLVSEGLQQSPHHGNILYPTNVASIRQVVHIRILWRPLPGTRADQPTATNAVIDWYVRSNMPSSEKDQLDYSGAGFVNVYPNKTGANVVIRNASVALRKSSGDLIDLFGKPSITGSFNVTRNDGLLRDTLASLQAPATQPTETATR